MCTPHCVPFTEACQEHVPQFLWHPELPWVGTHHLGCGCAGTSYLLLVTRCWGCLRLGASLSPSCRLAGQHGSHGDGVLGIKPALAAQHGSSGGLPGVMSRFAGIAGIQAPTGPGLPTILSVLAARCWGCLGPGVSAQVPCVLNSPGSSAWRCWRFCGQVVCRWCDAIWPARAAQHGSSQAGVVATR